MTAIGYKFITISSGKSNSLLVVRYKCQHSNLRIEAGVEKTLSRVIPLMLVVEAWKKLHLGGLRRKHSAIFNLLFHMAFVEGKIVELIKTSFSASLNRSLRHTTSKS